MNLSVLSPSDVKPRGTWLIAALVALVAIDGLLLWLSPTEQTLGGVVKLVYLHGALIRVSLLALLAAGLLGLACLMVRRADVLRWLVALQRTAFVGWIIYALSSIWVTYAAWGVPIAWGEPRTMVSIRVTVAILAVFLVSELSRLPILIAVGNLALGAFATIAIRTTGVIRHPIDPIGGSPSTAIRLYYLGIVATTLAITTIAVVIMHRHSRRV